MTEKSPLKHLNMELLLEVFAKLHEIFEWFGSWYCQLTWGSWQKVSNGKWIKFTCWHRRRLDSGWWFWNMFRRKSFLWGFLKKKWTPWSEIIILTQYIIHSLRFWKRFSSHSANPWPVYSSAGNQIPVWTRLVALVAGFFKLFQ